MKDSDINDSISFPHQSQQPAAISH